MNILVVAAHPDDEAIGVGGTIVSHVRAGDVVHTLYLTSGEKGVGGDPDSVAIREQEAATASQHLGTKYLWFSRLPDADLMRHVNEASDAVRQRLVEYPPGIVYAPNRQDAHPDHKAALDAVRLALTVAPRLQRPPELFEYEVWTPLVKVDKVVDITMAIGAKVAAIRAHRSQCDRMRFDEAAYALARYRGEMAGSQVAATFAEVFTRMEMTDG